VTVEAAGFAISDVLALGGNAVTTGGLGVGEPGLAPGFPSAGGVGAVETVTVCVTVMVGRLGAGTAVTTGRLVVAGTVVTTEGLGVTVPAVVLEVTDDGVAAARTKAVMI